MTLCLRLERKPLISPCYSLGQRDEASYTGPPQGHWDSSKSTKDHKDELISDLLIQGNFYWGNNILVAFRVTDPDAK